MLVASAMLVGCGARQPRGADTADLVLAGGSIFTGDPARPRVEAIAIRGDRVIAIGRSSEMPHATRTMDLRGRLVIPGINDAHVHEPSIIKYAVEVPGEFETITLPLLLKAIEETTRKHAAGTWLHAELGRELIDEAALTRQALDRVAPDHPVWIDNFAGHAVVLNSAALRELALDPAGPPPRGGFIGHDANGAADGWRYEYARYVALRRLGADVRDQDIAGAIGDFEDHALAFGITSVQTLPTELEPARLMILLRAMGPKLRWHVMRLPVDELATPPRAVAVDPKAHVVFSGTKYFLDGTPIERGAALLAPYSDRATSGRMDWYRNAVRQMLEAARASGDALHVHVAGDRSVATVLDLMDEIGGDWRAQRVVLEHGDGLAKRDYARAKRLGVVVVQNPSHAMPAELMRARIGNRVNDWMPMRSVLAAGIAFALGSDGPLNPFLNISFATKHPTNPGEALTREQALVAYTQGAAFDERSETFKGKLVPGMVADLAVLSQDIFTVPDAELPKTRSVMTIVGGKIMYDAR